MRKRLLVLTAGLAGLALAAGAVPAFTAQSGTINVNVTAQAPPAPCVEFAASPGTQVSFGTAPFSTSSQISDRLGDVAPRFSNCSNPPATESFLIAAEDAKSAGTTWTVGGGFGSQCPTLNKFNLFYSTDHTGSERVFATNNTLRNLSGGATTFAPGEAHDLGLEIVMPCQGSVGAGLTFSLNVTLTAVVA